MFLRLFSCTIVYKVRSGRFFVFLFRRRKSRVRVIKVTPAFRKLSTGDNIALVSRVFEEDEEVSQFDCDQTVEPLLYRLALYDPTFLLKKFVNYPCNLVSQNACEQDKYAIAADSCCYFHTLFP